MLDMGMEGAPIIGVIFQRGVWGSQSLYSGDGGGDGK